MSTKQDLFVEAVKSAPPVAVTAGSMIMGYSLNEWVSIITIGWVLIQAGFFFHDRIKKKSKDNKAEAKNAS